LLSEGPNDHPGLARLRGRLALVRRDGPAAVRHYRVADAAEPNDRETLYGLGHSLLLVGDAAAAEPYLRAARAHDALGVLVQRAALAKEPVDPALLRSLGAACEAAGKPAEARAWYQLSLVRAPLEPEAQRALKRLGSAINDAP
jgi:Flp pilus assembly protein TadD